MTTANATNQPIATDTDRNTAKRLVMLSGAFLLVQVASTDYDENSAPAFWFVVGVALLWFVYQKRSSLARHITVVTSVVGAAIYAVGALEDMRAAILMLAFAGQAVPLMLSPVVRHVDRLSRTQPGI